MKKHFIKTLLSAILLLSVGLWNIAMAQCPTGYGPGPLSSSLAANGSFATQGGSTPVAGVSDATTAGVNHSALGFYSQAGRLANNGYAGNGTGGYSNVFSLNTGSVPPGTWFGADNANAFPGDPANNVPAISTWFYSNGNKFSGAPEYLLWGQTISGLIPGVTYTFFTYVNNIIEPPTDATDDPVIRLRIGGAVDLPNGTAVAGPITLTETLCATTQPLGGWIRLQYTFTATSTSEVFKITSAGTGEIGDDFSMTGIGVVACTPKVIGSVPSPVCVGGTANFTATPPAAAGTYTYAWSGPNGFTSTFKDPVITPLVAASFGTYTVTITDANGLTGTDTAVLVEKTTNCCPAFSGNTISAPQSICAGITPAGLTGTTGSMSPSGGALLYQWLESTTSATAGFTPISGANTKDYSPGMATDTVWYRRVIYIAGCPGDTTPALMIAANVDCDGDGVPYSTEITNGTDPNDPCKYLPASQSLTPSTAWNNGDCDGDGVTNGTEKTDGTNPLDPCKFVLASQTLATTIAWNNGDCDGDGVKNGKELSDNTNPLDSCSFILASQTLTPSAAWNAADCDGDGVTNGTEKTNGTNPLDVCSYVLASQTLTPSAAWNNADCDGDGVTNATEKTDGTDPLDPCKFKVTSQTLTPSAAWNAADCDGDGVPNGTEKTNGTDPTNPCSFNLADQTLAPSVAWNNADCDGDGVKNSIEVTNNTNPKDSCSFVLTSQSLTPSAAWNAADCDGDGVTNSKEKTDGTNPLDVCSYILASQTVTPTAAWNNADCDGDGVTNATEVANGTDPYDICSFILASQTLTPIPAWKNGDCDGDGVTNNTEKTDGTDPLNNCSFVLASQTVSPTIAWNNKDCDGDGVKNVTESANGTNPLDPCSFRKADITLVATSTGDCDGDGVLNKDEINGPDGNPLTQADFTDPTNPCDFNVSQVTIPATSTGDCDGDGVTNMDEINGTDGNPATAGDNTNPNNPCNFNVGQITIPATNTGDCDGDGVTNKDEINGPDGNPLNTADNTNPLDPCSLNLAQVTVVATSTTDCDGDGVTNKDEINGPDGNPTTPDGTNPNDPCSLNLSQVTIAATSVTDCDGDGVLNKDEINGTDGNPLTPGDNTNPNNPCNFNVGQVTVPATNTGDCDGDGVVNKDEINGTDGDPLTPGDNTNPNDPCSLNQPQVTVVATNTGDCDGDGVLNKDEINGTDGNPLTTADNTDPKDPCSFNRPQVTIAATSVTDCDGDGVLNKDEINGPDGDPMTLDGTDAKNPCDYIESQITILATSTGDCDGDGIMNKDEINSTGPNDPRTNPNDPCNFNTPERTVTPSTAWNNGDCDGDGASNGDEITSTGPNDPVTDPLNTCSFNKPDITLPVTSKGCTTPDVNATFVNVPLTGNVKTNDNPSPGTTYGTPVPATTNPSADVPTINPDGTYTFTSTTPGVYVYEVPVCPAGGSTTVCPMEILTITVLDPNKETNIPVANTDITTTPVDVPVTLATLANDKSGNQFTKLDPATVAVTTPAKNGTTTVDALTGDIKYTPNTGFVGKDTVEYTVCDNGSPANCTKASQIITILPATAPNSTTAADDYASGPSNGPLSGNAKKNDSDPEGHGTSITPQTTPIAGKGTLDLKADGSYTFTPEKGFEGPVEFPYESCDSGTPKACTMATIHILIEEYEKINPDVNATFVKIPVTGDIKTNDIVTAGTTYGTPTPVAGNPGTEVPTIAPDGKYTFTSDKPGVYQFNVPVCSPGMTVCPMSLLTITVLDPTKENNIPVANTDITSTKEGTPVKLSTLSNDESGNEFTNLVPSSVTITKAPSNGTATVDPATGDITYTPKPNFAGLDTLQYSVCDDGLPAKCTTAYQIITILPTEFPNTTVAADDYAGGTSNAPIVGNAKKNDSDPEGNGTTITPLTKTVPGKGTMVLNADGSFVFTPEPGFNGPVEFPYESCDSGSPKACVMATIHVLVEEYKKANPDVNTTFVNTPVAGNLKTNDIVTPGSKYGTPTPITGNPTTALPTVNPDGTYTFTSDKPGQYLFNVPICPPGVTANCPIELLTITVLDPNKNDNIPSANTDIATTKKDSAVTLKTLSNDKAGNEYSTLVPSTVTVTAAPKNGTATVDPATGDIKYKPKAGFAGMDTLKYQVCDNSTPSKCATAYQIITVVPDNYPNTTVAADDYNSGSSTKPMNGNVKTNDNDPEKNTQTVTPQTTTAPGKGTLVLKDDGSYVFTPVPGFNGPVEFPYTTCDNGTPKACVNATLHILVKDDLKLNPDVNATYVGVPTDGTLKTNDVAPAGMTYGSPEAFTSNPSTSTPTINPDGTYTFETTVPGIYEFNVPVCPPGVSTNCPKSLLTISVLDPNVVTNLPVANTDFGKTKENIPVILNTLSNDKSGNPDNKLVPSTVAITEAPKHGTAVVDPATGSITYTPAAGYIGRDTLKYKVCDDAAVPNCKDAYQIVDILPSNAGNITSAADDYNAEVQGLPQSGDVLKNDFDAEGDKRTATPQTTTIPGKGTLVLNSDGTYVFTPDPAYAGPVEFPYEVCDNGTPSACAKATIHFLVLQPQELILPNYFSPNADGENDKWKLPPALYGKYPNTKVIIYNRWGNIVWRSQGRYQDDWGGEHQIDQLPLPDGVYYYLIELEPKFGKTLNGFVEIMRQ